MSMCGHAVKWCAAHEDRGNDANKSCYSGVGQVVGLSLRQNMSWEWFGEGKNVEEGRMYANDFNVRRNVAVCVVSPQLNNASSVEVFFEENNYVLDSMK